MEARMVVFLNQNHPVAALGQQGGDGGTGRAAAGNENIIIRGCCRLCNVVKLCQAQPLNLRADRMAGIDPDPGSAEERF